MNKADNIDCMAAMAQMKDNEFDLAIVDPPYGINIAEWDDSIPDDEYFKELFRVSENQIIWGGNYFNLPHTEAWICWDKKPFLKHQSHFELAWTSFDMKAKMIVYTYAGNCEGIKSVKVDYEKKSIHPTQKPVNLYKILLKDYAKPGDTILDTHLGSGSSRIAAYEMGHDFTGYEIDKDYYNASVKRFENHIKQGSLFEANEMY